MCGCARALSFLSQYRVSFLITSLSLTHTHSLPFFLLSLSLLVEEEDDGRDVIDAPLQVRRRRQIKTHYTVESLCHSNTKPFELHCIINESGDIILISCHPFAPARAQKERSERGRQSETSACERGGEGGGEGGRECVRARERER